MGVLEFNEANLALDDPVHDDIALAVNFHVGAFHRDGAAALVGLNALWGCGFSREQLWSMAAELGSDMPFCIDGGSQLCFGRGEVL